MEIKGLDSFLERIDKLQKNVENLVSKDKIALIELLSDDFVKNHTALNSANEFLASMGFELDVEVASIPEDVLDARVREISDFETWNDFRTMAISEYLMREFTEK